MDRVIETEDMAVTPHIKLKLPSQNDYYDVDVDNENAGIIDNEIKKLQDAGKTHENRKDNPHAVTKVQVGLGEVQNYPVTSAVNDASNAKYATAGAVKIANDNANGRVSKSGDTMTGTLTVPSLLVNTSPSKGAKFGSSTYKALIGTSSQQNEYLIGGSNTGGDTFDCYIRVSEDVLTYKGSSGEEYIYHQGYKPTASDVGAVSKSGDIMTAPLSIDTPNKSIKFLYNGVEKGVVGKYTSTRDAIGLHNVSKGTFLELNEGSGFIFKGSDNVNKLEVLTSGTVHLRGDILNFYNSDGSDTDRISFIPDKTNGCMNISSVNYGVTSERTVLTSRLTKILGDYITSGTHTIPNLNLYKDRMVVIMASTAPSTAHGATICVPVSVILSNFSYTYRLADPVSDNSHEIKVQFTNATTCVVTRTGDNVNDSVYRIYLN